jgi:DUF1680 family protein
LEIAPASPTEFAIRLRIPEWAQGKPLPSDLYSYETPQVAAWEIRVNGVPVKSAKVEKGYLSISQKWKQGDIVEARFEMPVQKVLGNELLAATRDRVAFERGPVVYCFEHDGDVNYLRGLVVPESAKITPQFKSDLLGGVTTLAFAGEKLSDIAVPYFAWANRGLKPMTVWVRRSAPPAERIAN